MKNKLILLLSICLVIGVETIISRMGDNVNTAPIEMKTTDVSLPSTPPSYDKLLENNKALSNKITPKAISDNSNDELDQDLAQPSKNQSSSEPQTSANYNNSAAQYRSSSNRSNTSSSSRNSNGIKYLGEKQVTLDVIDPSTGKKKVVSVMDIQVDDNYKKTMEKKADQIAKAHFNQAEATATQTSNGDDNNFVATAIQGAGPKVDLGMANVKVFDQGPYGTCVTFATTAAIDAKMNAGDFISQQCLLELGVHLEKNKPISSNNDEDDEYLSGWDGSNGDIVLARIKKHGVVANQLCPHAYADNKLMMTTQEYSTYSKSLWTDKINWTVIPEIPEYFTPATEIGRIKKALDSGHRVVVGAFLDIRKAAGDMIDFSHPNGLWKLPPAYLLKTYINDLFTNHYASGHEVIITGYDDTKQMFKIRNSWGSNVGEDGEFYMTYDYYLQMSIDAHEIL